MFSRFLIMVLIWIETPKSILTWWLETKLTQYPEMSVIRDKNLFASVIVPPTEIKTFFSFGLLVCQVEAHI